MEAIDLKILEKLLAIFQMEICFQKEYLQQQFLLLLQDTKLIKLHLLTHELQLNS